METTASDIIRKHKVEFRESEGLIPFIDKVKDRKVVMLGEASHGTYEYYNWRARITRLLMSKYDFDFMAVEGDWPPCYKLNRHVKNYRDAEDDTFKVLKHFDRWPGWMQKRSHKPAHRNTAQSPGVRFRPGACFQHRTKCLYRKTCRRVLPDDGKRRGIDLEYP